MKEEDYLKTRIDDQINWYNAKAATNKKLHYSTKSLIIIISSFIPLMAGIEMESQFKNILLGLLGTCIAILTGLTALIKFQEKWLEYRTTSESMIQEKFLFQTLTGPYDNQSEPFKILVNRIENILSNEHVSWSQYMNENSTSKS